jgi:hypothetical protein
MKDFRDTTDQKGGTTELKDSVEEPDNAEKLTSKNEGNGTVDGKGRV